MNMSESEIVAALVAKMEQMSATSGGMFLTDEEVTTLSGRKAKGRQIEALRKMGVAFYINATGHPVVARSAVDGGKPAATAQEKPKWVPRVLQTGK